MIQFMSNFFLADLGKSTYICGCMFLLYLCYQFLAAHLYSACPKTQQNLL